MSMTRKIISIVLSVCLLVSVAVVGVVPVSAETAEYETYAQDTVQGGAILHCFDWSYNNIKANLADIAKAGYTAVQTSPVQSPKDYNSSWTDASGQWWKLYQPLGFSVSNNSWLGTKAELTSLCTEAEKYDIKVVVDIVANHLANNGTDGGTFSYLNSGVESDLKNANYYHKNNSGVNDDSRYNITQYHLGMPDLNTGNSYVQQKALGLLEECIDCGVDGFRFDAAKHIELPDDPSNCKSEFWSRVINGATEYAEGKNVAMPFYYGEILGSPGPNCSISSYTNYMAVTDNVTGDRALDKAYWQAASELADSRYYKGASASRSVLWVESHDTYMGSSGSAWTGNTSWVNNDIINRAWAIVGARANSTALFFARPNSVMGAASSDTNWKSKAVAEVNKFKNHFNGTSENLSSSGSTAYIERGTRGVVISKLDGSGAVSLTAHSMKAGTYTDQITGGTFTVANGVISGNVGSTGIAVVYNENESAVDTISAETLYLNPNIWNSGDERFAMYVFNNLTGDYSWASMTDSDSDGVYEASVPNGAWTGVIFCRMDGSTSENTWDNKWEQTVNLFPSGDNNRFTVTGYDSSETEKYTGRWGIYSSQETPTEATEESTEEAAEDDPNTYTIYVDVNNVGWSNVNVYYWGIDNAPDWPGTAMTKTSDPGVYTYDIPVGVTGIIFDNGNNGDQNQTVNITSDFGDGVVWTVNNNDGSGKRTVTSSIPTTYYLVGSMNEWTNNASYAFEETSVSGQYALRGVSLPAGAEIKVHGSNDIWYPDGMNNHYTVSSAGTYNVYFRPDGQGNEDWHEGWFFVENATPHTITFKDSYGDTLQTLSVAHGATPVYSGPTPVKDSTDQYSYTFSGWSSEITAATEDKTYTAQFTETVNTYTVKWVNYNNHTLETDENVEYGATPEYNGVTPTREASGNITYVFTGWSPEISEVTGDVTYTAHYISNEFTYTVTWKNDDGTVLKTDSNVPRGTIPSYKGTEPVKDPTQQYSYTFSGWTPAFVPVTEDVTYTAQYTPTTRTYDVVWKNYNGEVLKTDEDVEYGVTPEYTGEEPTKPSDLQYAYTFSGWEPAVSPVTQEVIYTAQFTESPVPAYNISVNNAINWDNVYVYYWKGGENNSWPGTEMTADSENFIFTASIPSNVDGIIFNNGADGDGKKQTPNVEEGIGDGAKWAVSLNNNVITVNKVPIYYLVGSMTDWKTDNAPTFTPIKNDNGLEEYKLSGVQLNNNDQVKVYSSDDVWYPSGSNYVVDADGTYDIYFRPNGDGNDDWHELYFYLVNVTAYTITWKDGDGNTIKTEQVRHGDTPLYSGDTPTKTADETNHYAFNGTWSSPITAATADATYTAQFDAVPHNFTEQWNWQLTGDTYSVTLTLSCGNCNYSKDIPVRQNDIGSNVTTEPTCTETGVKTFTATVTYNGKNYSGTQTQIIPALGHHTAFHPGTSATCTEPGNSSYYSCDRCEKYFSDFDCTDEIEENRWVIPGGHNLVYHPYTAPTVSTDGNIEYWQCSVCGKYFSDPNGFNEITQAQTVIRKTAVARVGDDYYTDSFMAAIIYATENDGAIISQLKDTEVNYDTAAKALAYPTFTVEKNDHLLSFSLPSDFEVNSSISDNLTTYTITHRNHSWRTEWNDNNPVHNGSEWTVDVDYICTVCGEKVTVKASVSDDSDLLTTVEPTCTQAGYKRAYFTALYDGVSSGSNIEWDRKPATGHSYGEPVWNWADDYSSATATFNCIAEDDTQTLEATISREYRSDKTVYTATVSMDDKTYTDSRDGAFKLFIGHSLTLEGDIGVNFFLNPSVVANKNAQVQFSWRNKTPDPVDVVYDSRRGMYKATCYVAVAEMTCPITATVYVDGVAQLETNEYTVKEYADYTLTNEKYIASYKAAENAAGRNGEQRYADLKKLVETMLDYGTKAQIRFNINQTEYANGGKDYYDNEVEVTPASSDMRNNLEKYGLTYNGTSIIYLSKTTLRHYYTVTNTETFAQFENVIVPSGKRDGMIYFDITNIGAPDLGYQYTLTLGDDTYYYSVLDYIGKMLVNDSFGSDAKELGRATVRYYNAAVDYFG